MSSHTSPNSGNFGLHSERTTCFHARTSVHQAVPLPCAPWPRLAGVVRHGLRARRRAPLRGAWLPDAAWAEVAGRALACPTAGWAGGRAVCSASWRCGRHDVPHRGPRPGPRTTTGPRSRAPARRGGARGGGVPARLYGDANPATGKRIEAAADVLGDVASAARVALGLRRVLHVVPAAVVFMRQRASRAAVEAFPATSSHRAQFTQLAVDAGATSCRNLGGRTPRRLSSERPPLRLAHRCLPSQRPPGNRRTHANRPPTR